MEARANYVRRVTEMVTQAFISNDTPNVVQIVVAGNGDFKCELVKSSLFDPRLQVRSIDARRA